VALVEGRLKDTHGRMELAIGRDLKRRTRMAVHRPKAPGGALPANARAARTDWRVLAEINGATLAEVQLHTGRTHQIRVHFSAMKHPVVGDKLYGATEPLRVAAHAERGSGIKGLGVTLEPLGRNFLHAAKIGFAQPRNGMWIDVKAPLPGELREFLKTLTEAAGEDLARIDAALAPYL
jgi:23S rRNA pseudouridine1911/1915/1917 synthase